MCLLPPQKKMKNLAGSTTFHFLYLRPAQSWALGNRHSRPTLATALSRGKEMGSKKNSVKFGWCVVMKPFYVRVKMSNHIFDEIQCTK